MGKICLPEMDKYKYKRTLACGSISAGGTLGILIPPSTGFMLYAINAGIGVGPMFIAGIIPGIILTICYSATVIIICTIDPHAGPKGEKYPLKEKLRALGGVLPVLLLFILVLGGILFGWCSATEGGAVGAFGAFIFLAIRRKFTPKYIIAALKETADTTAMIFMIMIGSDILSQFFTMTGISNSLNALAANTASLCGVLIIFLLIYGLLGLMILSLAMVFSLAACGGSSGTSAASAAPAATEAPAAAASSAPETAAASSAAPEAEAPAATEAPAAEAPAATGALPSKADFAAGPAWSIDTEPTKDNGPWAQSYAVIAALAEQAKAYDSVAPQYTFTLACHDPAESAPGEFLTAWADAVTIMTEGAVDFNIGWSGSMSGTMASLDDMKSGTIDFDWTLPCYFKGYMPLTNVIQNPGLGIKNGTVGSYTMWEFYKNNPALQDEYVDDGELLFVWTNCTSPLSYKGSEELSDISQISGNIRANNGPAQIFVEEVGASVFGCPIGDVYSNVQNSIINYLVTDWHGIKSFALSDVGVLNYYLDTNVGCSAYALMANSDIWSVIDPDTQQKIKDASGDYLLNLVDIWSFWEAAGRYGAVANGGTIYAPSAELDAALQTAYENVAATWISQQDDAAAAQSLYDQAKELVAKYNEEFNW